MAGATRALALWLALLRLAAAPAAAADVTTLATAEELHQRPFWHLGEGFVGSASDWTEYAVWLIGVIAVLAYMVNPNMRRNLHAVEDDAPTLADEDTPRARRLKRD